MANKLSFVICHEGDFPTEPVLILFQRIADLGHFEELAIEFECFPEDLDIADCGVQGLVRAALANSNLSLLDLNTDGDALEWDMHSQTLLEGLKDYHQFRTFLIVDFGPNFSFLRRFLSHNRNITGDVLIRMVND